MPTSGNVGGLGTNFSFSQFSFTNLPLSNVDAAHLSQFDTAVLLQVPTSMLSLTTMNALSSFVTGGGKLIIYDSDATDGNDYSWLPAPAKTGQSCPNCGARGGTAKVIENNTMVSSDPADADHFIGADELPGNTDAVGDANVMVSQDPRWFVDIRATNNRNETGAVHTYATAGKGLLVYNGFDTDFIGQANQYPSRKDWLAKLWFSELRQGWDPDGLPHTNPVSGPAYVAVGDSLTTGFSIPTCNYALANSPYGCQGTPPGSPPPATPWPDQVAQAKGLTGSYRRVGIWGYTAHQVVLDYQANVPVAGRWEPQLRAVDQASQVVTMILGIDDFGFSDWKHWLFLCNTGRCQSHADEHVASIAPDLDVIFARLAAAHDRGVKVVVLGYHNPYSGGGGPGCGRLNSTADTIVNTFNNELRNRATANHLIFAPIRPVLDGHGAGSSDPWVFGRSCDLGGVVSAFVSTARPWCPATICTSEGAKKVQAKFDPHFNNSGTSHVAAVVEQALG